MRMTTKLQEELTNEDKIFAGYSTKDFEFVVACMALEDVDVRVIAFTPYKDTHGRRKGQVNMHLAVYKDGAPMEKTTQIFNKLRIEYQNRTFKVDPRNVFENTRTLRSMIIDIVDQMNPKRR